MTFKALILNSVAQVQSSGASIFIDASIGNRVDRSEWMHANEAWYWYRKCTIEQGHLIPLILQSLCPSGSISIIHGKIDTDLGNLLQICQDTVVALQWKVQCNEWEHSLCSPYTLVSDVLHVTCISLLQSQECKVQPVKQCSTAYSNQYLWSASPHSRLTFASKADSRHSSQYPTSAKMHHDAFTTPRYTIKRLESSSYRLDSVYRE